MFEPTEWRLSTLYHTPCGEIALTTDGEHYQCPKCGEIFEWGPDPTIAETIQ